MLKSMGNGERAGVLLPSNNATDKSTRNTRSVQSDTCPCTVSRLVGDSVVSSSRAANAFFAADTPIVVAAAEEEIFAEQVNKNTDNANTIDMSSEGQQQRLKHLQGCRTGGGQSQRRRSVT